MGSIFDLKIYIRYGIARRQWGNYASSKTKQVCLPAQALQGRNTKPYRVSRIEYLSPKRGELPGKELTPADSAGLRTAFDHFGLCPYICPIFVISALS